MTRRSWAWPSVLLAALAIITSPGRAQQATAVLEHPLKRGFEAAWARQPEQQSSAQRREANDASLRASKRWTPDAPSLEVTGKTDRVTRNNGGREYEATVAIPLWLPGERTSAQAVTQAESGALAARLEAARWRLAEQVRGAYWEQARTLVERELSQRRLANARLLAADVAKRLSAGDLARADGHQAEGAVAAAEAAASEAAAAASRAARQWQALTGLGAPDVQEAEPMPPAVPAPSHPALAELAARADVAKRQRDLAGAQTRANPELTVGAVRDRGTYGERYGQSVVVGVRIPLGTASASPARIATAAAEQLEAEAALAVEQRRFDAESESARDDVRALQTSAEAAAKRARLARESRGFFEKSFRLGESDLPTRLRVELEAVEAERQAARARIELSAAISRLRQALGLLPE